MKVSISTPETVRPTGNFGTAFQWAGILRDRLGHEVEVTNGWDAEADALVALHARKSAGAIRRYKEARPGGRILVAAAGTDIYPTPSREALASFAVAERIILLQDRAIRQIPERDRAKAVTILQAATTSHFRPPEERNRDPFQICVIGFLRDIKDPMRTALAVRMLPQESKVRVRHAGGILEEKYAEIVAAEQSKNPRYTWLGVIDREEIDILLSESQLMVLSSHHEGGARVIGYAVVNHTPVLAARNDCTISLLGESYPGLYPVGDTAALAGLIHRAETDGRFLAELREITARLVPKFDPERETEAWRRLL